MNEMPLLIFTLIEQTTVGAFIALVVMQFLGKVEKKSAFKIAIVLFVLAVLGMIASLFHVGQPLRSLNIMRGLATSWLSREVLLFGLFVLGTLVYALLAKFKGGRAAGIVGIIGAICGLGAVICTGLAYMLPGVPAWDSITTPLQFFLTAVACGISLYAALQASFAGAGGSAGVDAAGADAGAAGADAARGAQTKRVALWWIVFVVLLISQIAVRYLFFADIVLLIDLA